MVLFNQWSDGRRGARPLLRLKKSRLIELQHDEEALIYAHGIHRKAVATD
jgi:hypothetical protein